MPRSSKHKSSKHSSRDARDYSDSEKDSSLKDRKGKDESVAKDISSSEKRKLDLKDVHGSANGEYFDEYGSSKRRKERSNDGLGERWNGGDDDRGDDGSKKFRTSGDSKSRRRDESVGVYGEGEELKKASGKSEAKYKDSGRKESRESGLEKERKVKESRSERSVDNEEHRISKQVPENTTDSKGLDELRSTELGKQLESQMKKKRDNLVDGEKHQDDVGDGYNRHLSTRDDIAKDARQKDEKRKDEKYRGKYREEMDRENKHRHDKLRDDRPAKNHTGNRADDKDTREEKDTAESREKRTKLSEGDLNHTFDRDEDKDRELDSGHDCERHHECSRDRDRAHDQDRMCDYDHNRDHDYDKDWGWDCDRDHDRERERDRDRDQRRERDGSHVHDRSAKSKESGTKKRTLDDRDDYSDTKYRVVKAHYSDAEKRSGRADSDADKGRSQSRQAHADSTGTSTKTRSSPISNSHIGKEEYRNVKSEDPKYRDTTVEERAKGSREGFYGLSERPKYKSMEKIIKIDDAPTGDLLTERSSSSKASPMGLVERSPSSTSTDRRYMNRSGVKRLEIEETGWRNSTDGRDFPSSKDRINQELTLEKHQLDESSQADSSFYGSNGQGNTTLIPPPPVFRSGLDRAFMGSLEDDVRDNSNARYRRSNDAGFGRGQGNSWRGVQNWTSVPNGFLPFQHGPGGFQAMMPQFPPQPLFGVRPPMEVNHAGLPYHIPDADRFPGHLRPLGWQNIMDGCGPSHLHGWDSNGVFRDDPHMYGGSDWERNRNLTNSRGWDSGSETRKEENGDLKELSSATSRDESVPSQVDDSLAEQAIQMSQDVHSHDSINEKALETKAFGLNSPVKEPVSSLSLGALEKVLDTSIPSDKSPPFSRFYVSKLDISAELAPPELYDQCICLLNVKKNACDDADASVDLYLKDGSRARQIYAATFSRASPFPAVDPSVFQKAMDIYKKQRIKMPNGEKLDIISVVNQVQVDEPITKPRSEAVQVSVSTSDTAKNMPMCTLDLKETQTISSEEGDLEELEPTHSHKGNDQVYNHSLLVAMSAPSSGHNNKGESVPGLSKKKDEFTSKQLNSGHGEETCSKAVKSPSQMVPSMQGGDDMSSKAQTSGFAHNGDEKPGFSEALGGSVVFEDGYKACDVLMPGSNESESLIFSWIHHSPKSTH